MFNFLIVGGIGLLLCTVSAACVTYYLWRRGLFDDSDSTAGAAQATFVAETSTAVVSALQKPRTRSWYLDEGTWKRGAFPESVAAVCVAVTIGTTAHVKTQAP